MSISPVNAIGVEPRQAIAESRRKAPMAFAGAEQAPAGPASRQAQPNDQLSGLPANMPLGADAVHVKGGRAGAQLNIVA